MYTGGTTGPAEGCVARPACRDPQRLPRDDDAAHAIATPSTCCRRRCSTRRRCSACSVARRVGAHSVIVPMFEPTAVMKAVETYQPTITVMVPTMIGLTMAHPEFRPAGLGSFTRPRLRSVADAAGAAREGARAVPRHEHLAGLRHDREQQRAEPARARRAPRGRRSTCARPGMPLPGRRAVASRTRRATCCRPGETGEVCARAGNYMIEYWNKPDATAEAFRGGWYHTGDAGYLDERRLPVPRRPGEGHDRHRRRERVLAPRSRTLSPSIPRSLQVAVIGIPSEKWGEAVHAIVVLKPDATATERGADRPLPASGSPVTRCPRASSSAAEPLPLSGAMKVLKKDLREPYWEGHDTQGQLSEGLAGHGRRSDRGVRVGRRDRGRHRGRAGHGA